MIQDLLNGFVAQTADAPSGGLLAGPIIPIVLMFAVFYFLIIRPQSKQQKQHQSFLGQLKKGDEVVLSGGLLGKVHSVGQNEVTVEIASNVRVRALKTAVSGAAPGAESAGKAES